MKNDIIRFENNVPDNYLISSRDYQALLRLFTFGINSSKFDIDNIKNLNDASYVNSRLLNLLSLKVGFFTKEEFKDQYLREVLKVFSLIVKKKGTRQAIYDAINLYFRACRYNGDYVVEINNKDNLQPYMIRIGITKESKDIILLEEILKYILPAGYLYEIFKYYTAKYQTNYYTQDMLTLSVIDDYKNKKESEEEDDNYNIHDNISNIFVYKSALENGESSSLYYNVYSNVSSNYVNVLTYPSMDIDDLYLYDGDFTVSITGWDTPHFNIDEANMPVLIHQYLKDKRIVCDETTWSLVYNESTNKISASSSGFPSVTIDYDNFIRNLPLVDGIDSLEDNAQFQLEYKNNPIEKNGFILKNDKRSFRLTGYEGNKLIIKYVIDSQYLGKRIDNIIVYKYKSDEDDEEQNDSN